MLHFLKALFIFVLAVGAAAAEADPPGRVGRLNYISGSLSFAPGEAPEAWGQALVNRPLTSGDRLWADRGARGEMHVGSTAVRFASLTHMDVLHLDDSQIRLRLSQGALNIRVRELEPDDLIEIATPAGTVVLREPGSYGIATDSATAVAYVTVHFGQAEVLTPAQGFTVPSGQVAVIPASGQMRFEIAGPGDEFDRWSAERDSREDRVASTRYVSSYMTGYEDLDHYGSWRTVPEYGAVWVPARVAPDWAPYRHGRWAWVSPWGWTWIDDAPWGFAPFHYGRWVWVHDHWAWAPGRLVRRPVYAPALVAFVGGPEWSVSIAQGPAVGWFPLGWREPFHPWYRASHTHIRNVNVTHVTNATNVNVIHVHRHRPHAVTVVPRRSFVGGGRAAESRIRLPQAELARAQVLRDRAPAEPGRASIARDGAARRPSPSAISREVFGENPASRFRREPAAVGQLEPRTAQRRDTDAGARVIDRERVQPRQADRDRRRSTQPPAVTPPAVDSAPPARVPQARAATPASGEAASRPDAHPSRSPGLEQRSETSRRARDAKASSPSAVPPAGPTPETRSRGVEVGRSPGAGARSRPHEQPIPPLAGHHFPQTGAPPAARAQHPSDGRPGPENRRSAQDVRPQPRSGAGAGHPRAGVQHESYRSDRSAARQQRGPSGRPGTGP